jgi:hypothetical protein
MTSMWNTDLLESVGEKFMIRSSQRQTIHNLVNTVRTTGLLMDEKQKYKRGVLIEGKLDDIGARLEHTPRKSLKCLA